MSGARSPRSGLRLALPKGRNSIAARAALAAAGHPLESLESDSRLLLHRCERQGLEVMLLKDWDLPRYVEHGIADAGIVGSDVLDEVDARLLVPVRLLAGRCRLSLAGRPGGAPRPGEQVRLATKYPRAARRLLSRAAWGAEILPLSGSLELAPLLDLTDVILDVVQTGETLREHGLVEFETVAQIAPCLVVQPAAWHERRTELNRLIDDLLAAQVAA